MLNYNVTLLKEIASVLMLTPTVITGFAIVIILGLVYIQYLTSITVGRQKSVYLKPALYLNSQGQLMYMTAGKNPV